MSSLAYQALEATIGPCALFESTTAASPLARRSILARHPYAMLRVEGHRSQLRTTHGTADAPVDLAAALRALLAQPPPSPVGQAGGIVGLLAYDAARPGRPAAPTPLLVAMGVSEFLIEEDGRLQGDALSMPVMTDFPGDSAAAVNEPSLPLHLPDWSSLTRAEHRRLVLRIKEHIAAGDIYQANLSQRFQMPWSRGGLALYRHLRRLSPAPFAGYARIGDLELVSASPERLISIDGLRMATRPIAGTRPRASDPAADSALARDLLLNEKERAEHLMLVDLARNDLGSVARVGSVAVDELMVVEDYSHVRHIVSNVTGELAAGRDAIDALFALFPGGTITGVPKIRCMQILDALEPVPRGFYTGALFYLTREGQLDANILIRSAVVHDGTLTFHAGGGIVADSDPDREYEETLHKAEGMRLAIEATLRDPPGPQIVL